MKIGRALFAEALKNFNQDRFVVAFPIIGFAINLAAALSIGLLAVVTFPIWTTVIDNTEIISLIFGILLVVIFSFTHVLVQGSVMAAANQRYSGQTPTFSSAFAQASSRLGPLALFALLEATVGMVLRLLRENLKVAGDLLSFIGGLAWAVASYFAIPAVLFEGKTPIAAIRRSSEIIRSKWGAAVRVNLFAGAAFLLIWVLTVGVILGGFFVAFSQPELTVESMLSGFAISGIGILAILAIALVQSSVMSYACVALYRYAVGLPLNGFDSSQMTNAFRLKRQRFGLKLS